MRERWRRCRAVVRHEQRGAVAPFVAIVMTVLLLCAALAIDIGMERVGRTDMQSVADVVALDLSRELDGRTKSQLDAVKGGLATKSLDRNRSTLGSRPQLTVEFGAVDSSGAFQSIAAGTAATAVKVTAETDVGFAFGGLTGQDSGHTGRSAVATASQSACFRVGSYVARLDAQQSALLNPLLGGMLGSTVNLDLASYNGLASSSITLLDLVNVGQLGVGTVDQLLTTQISVRNFYLASARVLESQGKLAQAAVLRSLSVAASTPSIKLGDLVQASSTDSAALAAGLNVLDLVTGAAFLANRSRAVSVPNLGLTVPGVATLGPATLNVIEPPQLACGGTGTTAHTAQARLSLPLTINQQTVMVPGVGAVTLKATTLTLNVNLGEALATLQGVKCSGGAAQSLTVGLRSAVVGNLSLSGSMGVSVNVSTFNAGNQNQGLFNLIQSVLGLLSTVTVKLDTNVAVGASQAGGSMNTSVTVPVPSGYTTPVGASSGVVLGGLTTTAGASADVEVTAKLLGLLGLTVKHYTSTDSTGIFAAVLNPITGYVTSSVVNPILSSLQTQVITPLSRLLGLQLAGADVYAVPTPTCAHPRLSG